MSYPNTVMISPEKPAVQLYRGKLGEPLNAKCAEFNLDPNMRVTHGAYNCLHDPLLKSFFRQPERKKLLLKQGLISTDDQVLCSLRELNQYVSYIKKVQQSWNKHYHQQQKQLLTDFLLHKMEGRSPQKVSYSRMTNWLISRSRTTFRKLSKKIMKPGISLHDTELAWEVGQRIELEKLHKEIIRELRLNRPPHRVPMKIRKSGGPIPAPPCSLTAASVAKEPTSRDLADPVAGKETNGDLVVAEEDLQHEAAAPVPAALPSPPVHSAVFTTMDLPFPGCSLPGISSYESRKIQSYASSESLDSFFMMDLAQVSEDAKEIMDFFNEIIQRDLDSPISEVELEIHPESLSPFRLSSDSPADESSELRHAPAEKKVTESSDLTLGIHPECHGSSELQHVPAEKEVTESLDLTVGAHPDCHGSSELQHVPAEKEVTESSDLTVGVHPDCHGSSELQHVPAEKEVTESSDLTVGVYPECHGSSELQHVPAEKDVTESSDLTVSVHPESFSSSPVSSDSPSAESTELQGRSSMDGMMESSDVTMTMSLHLDEKMVTPDTLVTRDLVSSVPRIIQVLPASEMSFDCHPDSPASYSVSSDSQAQVVSPDSEVTMDFVNGILKKIQESPSDFSLQNLPGSPVLEGRISSPGSYGSSDVTLIDLESLHSSRTSLNVSPMSSDMDALVISPTSEVAFDLVRGVLGKIQDSPSLGLRLTQSSGHEDPELQSFPEKDMGPNPPFATMEARGSSPESSVSSDITLIDLEMCVYSSSTSATSLSMTSPAQRISPKSEAVQDLVSDVLRDIEDSPCSDHGLSDPSSLVETTSIHVLQGLEADIAQSDAAVPTGTENPNMRKRVHTFFTRSWKSVRQIFAFARRRSRRIHPL